MRNKSKIPLLWGLAFLFVTPSCKEKEMTLPVKKNIEEAVFASGYIEQENNITVSAKVEGVVLSLPVKEGDLVGSNDLIAIIENDVQDHQLQDALAVYQDAVVNASADSPQMQHLQTQIDQAERQLAFDRENFRRYKDLWESSSVAKLDFERAKLQYEAAESNLHSLRKNYAEARSNSNLKVQRSLVQVHTQKSLLKDYRLTAGTSGQVIQLFKKQGELARRGEALAKIGSGEYIIRLFVAEEDIIKVDVGAPVAVNVHTYPEEIFLATIIKIFPAFDETEQSYVVEAKFRERPEKMFSGTQLQANIRTGSRKNVLVIPSDYVSRGSFVTLENGQEKQIETGSKNSVWTEVVSGIAEATVLVKPID